MQFLCDLLLKQLSREDSSQGDCARMEYKAPWYHPVVSVDCFLLNIYTHIPLVLQMALALHNSTSTGGLPSQASDLSSVRQASDAGSMAAELDSLEDKLAFLERSRQMTLQMSALFAQEMEAAAQMEEKHCLSAASPQITGRHAPAVSGVSSTWMADISYYASKSSTTSSPSSRRSHRRRISCSGSGRMLSRMQSSNSLPCPECHSM